MKKNTFLFLSIALATCALAACLNRHDKEKDNAIVEQAVPPLLSKDTNNLTTIQWLDSSKSLGTIKEGQVLKISFRFRNAGMKPLVIERVQPGCGCTVADYPKAPIAPGETGEILASFDSKGREGQQKKNITVFANTAIDTHPLWFDVLVEKSEF